MRCRAVQREKAALAVLLSAGVLLQSCSSPTRSDEPLTQVKAERLAQKEFIRRGYDLKSYKMNVQDDTPRQEWVVWFEPKGMFPPPGSTHSVVVEKKTGRAVFHMGE